MTLVLLPLLALELLVGCGESTVAGPAGNLAAAQRVFTVPATINADCSVDVTDALQKWFASVPDSSKLVFGQGACYNVDGGLVVADRHDLTFDGNGSTFQVFSRGTRDRANWTIKGGSNLTLRNMIARGANPDAGLADDAYDTNVEGQHAYRFEGTQTALLDSVQAYDVWGDFVEAEPDWRVPFPGPPVRGLLVRNSRFERNGRMGIGLTHVDGFVLQDSYVGDVRWDAIDVELDGPQEVARNIRIERNQFGPIHMSVFANYGSGASESVGNVTIRANVMNVPLATCLYAIVTRPPKADVFWTGWNIEGNTFRVLNRARAISLTRAKDVHLQSNVIIGGVPAAGGCGHESGVLISDSHSGAVVGNQALGGYTVLYTADSLTTGITYSGNIAQ